LFGRERADDPVPFEDTVEEEAQLGSEPAPGGAPHLLSDALEAAVHLVIGWGDPFELCMKCCA
jgi:hypothetical protein